MANLFFRSKLKNQTPISSLTHLIECLLFHDRHVETIDQRTNKIKPNTRSSPLIILFFETEPEPFPVRQETKEPEQ